jgi:hypothetical protein
MTTAEGRRTFLQHAGMRELEVLRRTITLRKRPKEERSATGKRYVYVFRDGMDFMFWMVFKIWNQSSRRVLENIPLDLFLFHE